MKDFKGNELKVGDRVVYVAKILFGASHLLREGKIEEVRKSIALLNGTWYRSCDIMKLSKTKGNKDERKPVWH
ncbi:MAG: hypothetical protein GY679_01805 [Mycoplasma sp.]|nr:hypothetical protein [Mycoplasma sp.]